jgi:hypothetical protein
MKLLPGVYMTFCGRKEWIENPAMTPSKSAASSLGAM